MVIPKLAVEKIFRQLYPKATSVEATLSPYDDKLFVRLWFEVDQKPFARTIGSGEVLNELIRQVEGDVSPRERARRLLEATPPSFSTRAGRWGSKQRMRAPT